MTYNIVLKTGKHIRIGEEKYEILRKFLTGVEAKPEFFEIRGWGLCSFNQIAYIEKEDDGKFRPEGY